MPVSRHSWHQPQTTSPWLGGVGAIHFVSEQGMTKSTTTYWNPLSPENRTRWTPIQGLEGMAEELTLSIDLVTGEYTRLTRFLAGADTSSFGGKTHAYPEEVFIVSGRLYDHAFGLWLGRPLRESSSRRASRPIPNRCGMCNLGSLVSQPQCQFTSGLK